MYDEIPIKKILVVSVNPKGTNPLRLDEEIRDIENVLQGAKEREKFQIKSFLAVRVRDIQDAILRWNPHIVHFSGHGAGEKGLILEDINGQAKPLSTQALAGLFELCADEVECVLLNACYSEVQAKAIAQHIDYVIGMNQEIGDKAAIEFAVGFYIALFNGKSFEKAYKFGRNAMQMASIPEHLTPQLLRKNQLGVKPTNKNTAKVPNVEDRQKGTVVSPSPLLDKKELEYQQKIWPQAQAQRQQEQEQPQRIQPQREQETDSGKTDRGIRHRFIRHRWLWLGICVLTIYITLIGGLKEIILKIIVGENQPPIDRPTTSPTTSPLSRPRPSSTPTKPAKSPQSIPPPPQTPFAPINPRLPDYNDLDSIPTTPAPQLNQPAPAPIKKDYDDIKPPPAPAPIKKDYDDIKPPPD
ncbi:MAG: CHAT domain-containing protein [Rivularia sp. (in: cyanobacteria)]